jgi:hypothetical protein
MSQFDVCERDEPVEIPFSNMIAETDTAWYLEIEDREEWWPKSICELEIHRKSLIGTTGTITAPKWMVEEKGI